VGALMLTDQRKKEFLKFYTELGVVTKAAKIVGITRQSVHQLRKKDEDFALCMKEAKEEYVDNMEAEAKRRAVDGVIEDVYYQGEKVGEKRVYSDKLLLELLKKEKPDAFRERKEITGPGGGPLEINILQFNDPELPIDTTATVLEPEEKEDGQRKTKPPTKHTADQEGPRQSPAVGPVKPQPTLSTAEKRERWQRADESRARAAQSEDVLDAVPRRAPTKETSKEEEGEETEVDWYDQKADALNNILGKLGLDD